MLKDLERITKEDILTSPCSWFPILQDDFHRNDLNLMRIICNKISRKLKFSVYYGSLTATDEPVSGNREEMKCRCRNIQNYSTSSMYENTGTLCVRVKYS